MLKKRVFFFLVFVLLFSGIIGCNIISHKEDDTTTLVDLSGKVTFPNSAGTTASIRLAVDFNKFQCYINDIKVTLNNDGSFSGKAPKADEYDIQIRFTGSGKAVLRAVASTAGSNITVDVNTTAHSLAYWAYRAQSGRSGTSWSSFSSLLSQADATISSLAEKIEDYLKSITNLEADVDLTDNSAINSATNSAVSQANSNASAGSGSGTTTTTTTTSTSTTTTTTATTTTTTTKPTATFSINNGEATTDSRTVTLYLTNISSGAIEMSIDNGAWVAIAAETSHTLSEGDGEKTVTMVIRDSNGTTSDTLSDTITLSTSITVTASDPASGTTGIKMSQANFTLTFSDDIDSSTVSTATFYVIASETLVPGTLSVNGRDVSFTPTYGFITETYTLTVTTGLKSTSGKTLESNYVSNFSVDAAVLAVDVNPNQSAQGAIAYILFAGNIFFKGKTDATGWEPYKSDGTSAGTSLLKDTQAGTGSGLDSTWKVLGSNLIFTADDVTNGSELWKSDGTTGGTSMIKDINPGSSGSSIIISNSVEMGGYLYFEATTASYGREIWRTDGTSANTAMVIDLKPGTQSGDFDTPAVLGSIILFGATASSTYGNELYKTDGTASGTVLVKDINSGSGSSNPSSIGPGFFIPMDGYVYFTADDGTNGEELWRSDGTSGNTTMVKNIDGGAGNSNPFDGVVFDGNLYFSADDGTNGEELWKSDGTSGGTSMLKDINAGAGDSSPGNFFNASGTLIFFADDGSDQWELWKTDGTASGTVKVSSNIVSGSGFTIFSGDNRVYFKARRPSGTGPELCRTDLTTSGTVVVEDIKPGSSGSQPSSFVNYGGTLFFKADDGTVDDEMWKLNY
ncbi:ELWxxDGT repeat protein [Candidatus Riflebacteria bacterium]